MFHDFRWIEWNLEKVEKHGLDRDAVEHVVNQARRPYPRPIGNEKWEVIGVTISGTWIEVIYLIDNDGSTLFVIHTRPLTQKERWQHHRTRRRRS